MIRLYGPKVRENITSIDETTNDVVVVSHAGLDVSQAKTVGQALDIYTTKLEVKVRPYDGSLKNRPLEKDNLKYFLCEYQSERFGACDDLVDIHVQRGEDDICIKQNLDFVLRDGDIVRLQELAC